MVNRKIIVIAFLLVLLPTSMFVINPYGTSSYDVRARLLGFIPYRIPSHSMAPTLLVGDFILVNAGAYAITIPQVNDVIVFNYPMDRSVDYVKRVVAREGEQITLQNGALFVDGGILHQAYIDIAKFPRTNQVNESWIVPEGHLFVLGDNRDNSNDSRYWGYVPIEDVAGRVSMIWMSSRISRIGMSVE